jgi:putative membrane protein
MSHDTPAVNRVPPPLGTLTADRLPLSLRPHPNLLKYNLLSCLLLGPFFLFAFLPLYFRYRSLLYEVDAEGITMRWGILFRREISLTYPRIQDIHLSSNFVERWLGLAKIQVQTASGSANAEMTIEGIPEYEEMRDYLYSRMRGAGGQGATLVEGVSNDHGANSSELSTTLRAIAAELRAIREEISVPRVQGANDA